MTTVRISRGRNAPRTAGVPEFRLRLDEAPLG